MIRRATEREGNPFGYVIPADQHDPSAADELTELLSFAGVEVREAREHVERGGLVIRKGDRVVVTRQPYGAFAQTMLEKRQYPDIRQYPGGPPKRPYDATAHSLPLKMGVRCHEIGEALEIETSEALSEPRRRKSGRGLADVDAPAYGIRPESNASARVVNRLLFEGHPVFRASAPFAAESGILPAGTWVAPASAQTREALSGEERGVSVEPIWRRPEEALKLLQPPRIGVYASYVPCIEEGWTRFVFDDYGFEYASLVDGDIREGHLDSRIDCLIVPHQTIRQLHRGFSRAHYSSRFSGGLGDRGVESLREFAERGGTIIGWDESARFLVWRLELAAKNPLARLSHSEFFAPGSLLDISIDTRHPIGYGMPEACAALFMNGPAYEVERGSVVARFRERDTLLSGWLIGADRIAGLAALAEIPLGLGRVILFGFRPHFRAQARGTYKLLFNSVYHSVYNRGRRSR